MSVAHATFAACTRGSYLYEHLATTPALPTACYGCGLVLQPVAAEELLVMAVTCSAVAASVVALWLRYGRQLRPVIT